MVFISPTIFHHIILAMTLFKSIKHLRITNAVGIGSIMRTIQRDHILYTLVGISAPLVHLNIVLILAIQAICLINFANLVLVLQHTGWPYKLVRTPSRRRVHES